MVNCGALSHFRHNRRPLSLLPLALGCSFLLPGHDHIRMAAASAAKGGYYRADGVRITHDPYAPEMAAKYGAPGKTDNEGFDPYADSVGAGIYSGTVQRDSSGAIVIGRQYQNHNTKPGPVYAGGGYTPTAESIALFRTQGGGTGSSLGKLLSAHPDLVNDVATGGALPLHSCGMSRDNQHAAAFLISRGADIEAVDTYGFTPLHRMASNNLADGAQALLEAGADPTGLSNAQVAAVQGTPSPLQVARQSQAEQVIKVLQEFGEQRRATAVTAVQRVQVLSAGYAPVVGEYSAVVDGATEIPTGFAKVCIEQGWDTKEMWTKLNGGEHGRWFKHESNDSYLYFNNMDRHWWIDGPDGLGAYKAPGPPWAPPGAATAWQNLLRGENSGAVGPVLAVHRGDGERAAGTVTKEF